jgi:hypothetical protein
MAGWPVQIGPMVEARASWSLGGPGIGPAGAAPSTRNGLGHSKGNQASPGPIRAMGPPICQLGRGCQEPDHGIGPVPLAIKMTYLWGPDLLGGPQIVTPK